MTRVTCRLTVKNRDQLQNPTLSNLVWAAFTFFTVLRHRWLGGRKHFGQQKPCSANLRDSLLQKEEVPRGTG